LIFARHEEAGATSGFSEPART
jgi:hypothetical protein